MILTKPASMHKGIQYTFSLDKTEILALTPVSADVYFSNPANWKSITLNYKSVDGNQYEAVDFKLDASQNILPATFYVSLKSRSSFDLKRIIIHDFDGGYLSIVRDDVPENMDIVLVGEVSDGLTAYASNFTDDAVIIGQLNSADPLTDIGQSFTMTSEENLRGVIVKAKRNTTETAVLTMKVYTLEDNILVDTSQAISSSDIGTAFTELGFIFNTLLPVGNYYFKISVSEVLNMPIDFAGKTYSSITGGSLYTSSSWYTNYDLDVKILIG